MMCNTINTASLSVAQTKKLNTIANDLRKEYVDFIDRCSLEHENDFYWWMTPLANRNNAFDDTLRKIALLYLCIDEIENNNCNRLYVDSFGLYKILKRMYGKTNIQVVGNNSILKALLSDFTSCMFGVIEVQFKQWNIKRNMQRDNTISAINVALLRPVISSQVMEKCFKDGYCTDIEQYYGKRIYSIPQLVRCDKRSWSKLTDELNKALDDFYIYHESFSKWYDSILYIKYIVKCCLFARKKYFFEKIDISPIIKESLLHVSGMLGTFCDYKSFDRFTKKIQINRLVMWYEARPKDNIMAMVYRKNNPTGKCIGYIGYPISEQFLGQRVAEGQQLQKACPEIIAVPGEKYIDEIREFNPNIKVITAPCLRNRYYRVKQLHHEKFTILAAMSYYSEDTIMMINIINKYCCLASDVAVNVKMHPANAMRKIEDYYKDRVTFLPKYVTGKLLDCIAEADVVFTSRSASSMEIICGGIPLICLCMPGELLDTSIAKEVSKDAYDIIYDDKDFAKAIEKIKLRKHNNAQRDIININPQDYFIEPTCENVKAFLEA